MKPYREPMFLNPVISAKTYRVFNGVIPIGEVNADDVHEAFRNAKQQFGRRATSVSLKHFKPCGT